MTSIVVVVIAFAVLFGVSPGLALIGVALLALAVDAYDPQLLDRLTR